MQDKEYENKWQYVMHTENMQAKFIQWYFTVCAAVFVFLYAGKQVNVSSIVNDRLFALAVLSLYSILTCLRLLAQKRNYDTYTKRLCELEGKSDFDPKTRTKIFSVFKLQYYVICILGGLVVSTFCSEYGLTEKWTIAIGLSYTAIFTCFSFTRLIGK